MLFSQDLSLLHDDDFEGSNDELRIAQEVFYGIDSAGGDERRELNAFINFGCQQHKYVGSSPSSKTGAVTSEVSSKDSCLNDNNNAHDGSPNNSSASVAEGFMLAEKEDLAVPVKRIKLSVNELFYFKPFLQKALASKVPLKALVSGVEYPNSHLDCQIVMSHVVESSGEGVKSSCYLLKQGGEGEKKDCLGDSVCPKGNSLGSDGSEGKEIVVSNAMASPVSQESCATKILVASPALANVDETGSRQRAVRKRKKGTPIELDDDDDDDDTPWTSDCTTEIRPLLRRKIFHFLAAAGWSIEKRKRKCRTYEEFVFISPEERPVRELSKAWSLCGQMLLAHEYKQMQSEDGKQWTDINQFCSDLYSTLANMENELKHLEPKSALPHQWVLLDPFVKVVFVDRKIQALRAGNDVKAKHNVSDAGEKSGVGKKRKSYGRCAMIKLCDSSLASESTVMDFDRQSPGGQVEASTSSRSIYVSEGNCMRLLEAVSRTSHSGDIYMNDSRHLWSPSLPACGSDTTCVQLATGTCDVPLGSGNEASDVVMHDPSQLCAEDAKPGQCFHFASLLNNSGCLDPKGKLFKKSKKLSKIKTASLLEDKMLNLSTSLRVEADAREMNEYTNKANGENCKRLPSGTKSCKRKTGKVKSFPCQLKDDDLLISAIVQNKRFRSNSSNCNVKSGGKQRRLKRRKSHKGGCRLLPRNLGKGGRHFPDGRWYSVAKRTVLSWLINTGVIRLNETIQYRDLKDETVVKAGLITKDGILCKCCKKVLSLSEFKVHAGMEISRLCLNLFIDSGQPFNLHLLEAWSAEFKARKASLRIIQSDEFDQNDDSCGLCGDGGELLCCDNCPSTFHQSCLSAEELPEGSWYCASCTCWICENLVDGEASSASYGFRCCQCEHKYHLLCLKEQGVDRIPSNPWFCSDRCEEVHSGLQSQIGLSNVIADGFSWSVLRCIHDDQKVHSAQRFALKAECNSKLAVALTIMEECFVSMVDARTGIDMIPHVVYNWGSEFPRLDYHGFYTMVLEKDDVLISVASIRVHGFKVAEMPLVATCSKYRRKGMCRRLLSAVEQMLISLKVEMLLVAAIPDLVATWTIGFGFVPVEDEEKKNLNKINLMVFPGTVMLKKTLYTGQTVDLQGAGSAASVSSTGEQCEDLGGLNDKLVRSYDTEVVEAQRTNPGSEISKSRDNASAVSGGCMSLQVCGDAENSYASEILPENETSEAVQNRNVEASYDEMTAGASMDSRAEPCNCLESWGNQECMVSHEGDHNRRAQDEMSSRVSSDVQSRTAHLPVSLDGADQCVKEGGAVSDVASGVQDNIASLLPQECSAFNGSEHEQSINVFGGVGSKAFNCLDPQELAGRIIQHEKRFDVENEVENQMTNSLVVQEVADDGRRTLEVVSAGENIVDIPFSEGVEPEKPGTEMSFSVAGEVENKITIPSFPHESVTSGVGNEGECTNTDFPLSREGAELEKNPQLAPVLCNEVEIKMPTLAVPEICVGQVATHQENNLLVLADELAGTGVNGKVDMTRTVRQTDSMNENEERASLDTQADEKHETMVDFVCQYINMVSCDSNREPGNGLEIELGVESEPPEASLQKNSSNPCSSLVLAAQHGCASDLETQFVSDNDNKLFLMDDLRKLVLCQNSSNISG